MDTLEGVLEKVLYYNEDSGYTVAKLKETKGKDVIIVGNFPANPGETVRLKGWWKADGKYGIRFQVEEYTSILPATLTGIRKYLGSGLIKGIGSVMAERIVDRFGMDTLEVIDQRPEKLLEVNGIGPVRLERIKKAWEEQKEIKEIMVFLQSHGISTTYATKIFKFYGGDTLKILRENPYRLALDIDGIGFKTADKIALKLGIDPNSIIRAEAAAKYLLSKSADDGHTFLPRDEIKERAERELDISGDMMERAITSMAGKGELVEDGDDVYLKSLYVSEESIARKLLNILLFPKRKIDINLGKALEWLRISEGIELSEGQRRVLEKALKEKVLIITGGPGTGKTTVIRALIKILKKENQSFLLASPTGRAAERLSEVVGEEAKTIHRLLEYDPKTGSFKRDHKNPLNADYIIVDEASMVDVVLMHHLLKAIPSLSTLILVGDMDQLPSVGPGNVLRDLIESESIPIVKLKEIFRQAEKSMIVVNAHRVNNGFFPFIGRKKDTDFYFIERENPENALSTIKILCRERIPRAFGFHPVDDIQVITPMRKGTVGVHNLNMELQSVLNPNGKEITRGSRTFRVGDKVIQLKNNYEKEVFNGDVGRIREIDVDEQFLVVNFRGRDVIYDFSELDEIALAYAISVHKSQGSEYKAVVMPILPQHYIMLQRNLLYTAITRAKKLFVLVGSKKAIAMAVKNNKVEKRYSKLKERISRLCQGIPLVGSLG